MGGGWSRVQWRHMHQPLPVIVQPPTGARERARHMLRTRRVAAAAGLALAEVVTVLVTRPGMLAATFMALLVLVAAVAGLRRVGPGLASDALIIVALAQGMVLFIPMLLGFSIALGLIVGAALVALLVVAAVGSRR